MVPPLYMVWITQLGQKDELSPYEQQLYNQLVMTCKAQARLDELIVQSQIRNLQDAAGTNQAPGGATQQDPETEEHRSDDAPPSVPEALE